MIAKNTESSNNKIFSEWLEKKIPTQILNNKHAQWIRSEFVTNCLKECLGDHYDDYEHLILASGVNDFPRTRLYHKFSKISAGEIIDYYLVFNPQGKYKTLDLYVNDYNRKRLTYYKN